MDERTKELIAVGASVAAHCQPCLRHHIDQAAALGIGKDEIAEAVDVGKMVQRGGLAAMRKFADALLENLAQPEPAEAPPRNGKALKIYEPAMCCATGVCGPNVEPRLVAFASALKQAAAQGIAVERFNLAQEPQAFVENAEVKAKLADMGHEQLPFIFVDGELAFSGSYPEPTALFAALGLEAGTTGHDPGRSGAAGEASILSSISGANENAGDCCPGEGCCG